MKTTDIPTINKNKRQMQKNYKRIVGKKKSQMLKHEPHVFMLKNKIKIYFFDDFSFCNSPFEKKNKNKK